MFYWVFTEFPSRSPAGHSLFSFFFGFSFSYFFPIIWINSLIFFDILNDFYLSNGYWNGFTGFYRVFGISFGPNQSQNRFFPFFVFLSLFFRLFGSIRRILWHFQWFYLFYGYWNGFTGFLPSFFLEPKYRSALFLGQINLKIGENSNATEFYWVFLFTIFSRTRFSFFLVKKSLKFCNGGVSTNDRDDETSIIFFKKKKQISTVFSSEHDLPSPDKGVNPTTRFSFVFFLFFFPWIRFQP